MSSNCPYANILGEPGTGFHSWRIGPGRGFAFGDIIATILVAVITSYVFNVNIWYSLIGWFIGGEIAHWAFGVPTGFLISVGVVGGRGWC